MATSADNTKHNSGFLVAPRVPQGLAAAVEGLTREVIRQRPEDIYVFAARHFEKLLELREQYEANGIPLDKDSRSVKDMGLTHLISPERKRTSRARMEAEKSGWSLNQTAKVLKRHRSILGESDASNDNQTPRTPKNSRKPISRHLDSSYSNESQSGDSEPRSTPKIIARMSRTEMTSKDIKNELRKNRMSSRERRSKMRSEEKKKIERVDTSESLEHMRKSSVRKPPDKLKNSEEKRQENGHDDKTETISRTSSMDKVKNYVVHKFSTTKSLDELQSLDYVEKVQDIITETEPIIQEKIRELKRQMSESKNRSKSSDAPDVLESRLDETQKLLESVSTVLSKPPGRSRSARALRRIRSVSMISTEDFGAESTEKKEEIMISELLIANGQKDGLEVHIRDATCIPGEEVKRRRSQSAKGSRKSIFEPERTDGSKDGALESMLQETTSVLAGLSSSFKMQNGFRKSRGSSSSSKSEESESQDPQNSSKVSLPAVRPKSAKNVNKNAHKNGGGSFVLPAISPEAPKSAKVKEELVLPVLSPPGSSSSKEPDIPEVPVEEVFKDSLNVSPEPLDFPPRPDSLEPEENIEDIEPPTSELKEKLMEIQEVERKIERVFRSESFPVPEEIEPTESDDELKKKLMELMEVEREVENVLERQTEVVQKVQEDINEEKAEENGEKSVKNGENPDKNEGQTNNNGDVVQFSDTYILTEGSPHEIPESVTTVIIAEPPSTPEEINKLPLVEEVEEPEEDVQKTSSDPFGEEVSPPEVSQEPLIDIISKKSDIIIHKQNLQAINEEEDEETLRDEETMRDEEVSEVPTSFLEAEEETNEPKSVTVSEDITRPEFVSISSTSAKETSVTDGPLETPKPAVESGEELTSSSGTAESSNEAKETTLTDGTSFSIDPTRPYVPELNLDSLQDITVSSFKMTEDEYDDQGENENTNSFTETLTPDENNRITSGKTNRSETYETEEVINDQSLVSEVAEEPCVQEFVEVHEAICEKKTVYVTEPEEVSEEQVEQKLETPKTSKTEETAEKHEETTDKTEETAEKIDEIEGKTEEIEEKAEESQTESDQELKQQIDEEKESESENFVEEDTPLAVSRSASQCTTRRVSSGNLARLREDMKLEEDEEDAESKNDELKTKLSSENDEQTMDDDLLAAEEEIGEDAEHDQNKEYHIYVPELDRSDDTTSESSFNSAATKIQAGVRGFLTRRRLQRMHHLSSTLNGVPSIQDSIAIDERPLETLDVPGKCSLEPENAATMIQSNFRGYKARKRLRREDAMQRTTISMERSFGEEGIRHTGEFHDCIPLPLLDLPPRIPSKTPEEIPQNEDKPEDEGIPKQPMSMMFGISSGVPVLQFGIAPKLTQLVDLVVLAKEDNAVESGYLNFITSVEDAEASPPPQSFFEAPKTAGSDVSGASTQEFADLSPRKGVIIEEITSLEEAKIRDEIEAKQKSQEEAEISENGDNQEVKDEQSDAVEGTAEEEVKKEELKEEEEVTPEIDIVAVLEAPLATLGFPMKQGKLVHYGSEDFTSFRDRRPFLEVTLTPGDPMKSLSLSQESQLAGERIESPITMMQIVPGRSVSLLQDDSGEIVEKKEGSSEAEEVKKEGEVTKTESEETKGEKETEEEKTSKENEKETS